MGKRDELDVVGARRFAWGMAGEPDEQEGEAEGEPDPEPSEEQQREAKARWETQRRDVLARCEELAAGTARAWAMRDLVAQARATEQLWRRAKELTLGLTAMQQWPLESVRLSRLLVRHLDRMEPELVDGACTWVGWLHYSHPETGDLVLEMARSGDARVHTSLWMGLHRGELPQSSRFAEQLAGVIDEGPTWRARRFALDFAGQALGTAVVPALLRALRAPNLGIRWRALHALRRRFASALRTEDVLWLLEDAVVHEPPPHGGDEEMHRALTYYPEELARATVELRPPGGHAPLARIAARDCAGQGFRDDLAHAWALGVLAEAYPEQALGHVDERLRAFYATERVGGVAAAARLPPDLARPRLLEAARDGAPEVSESAREAWRTLFGTACPSGELDPVLPLLGGAAPSDRLQARVLALRGPREARRKLLSVLLAEAPDPEALAALTVALSDDALSARDYQDGLPVDREAWCREIASRFGSPGVRAVCLLADRYTRQSAYGWMRAIDEWLEAGEVSESDLAAIRETAARAIMDPAPDSRGAALSIAKKVGFPFELHERLWALATDSEDQWFVRYFAGEALAAKADGEWCEAVVVPALRAALAGRDFLRVTCAARVLVPRGAAEAVALAREAVLSAAETADLERDTIDELAQCARSLRERGQLDADWTARALRKPETCGFAIAAQLCHDEATRDERRWLIRALSSRARGGAPAGEAANALLRQQVLGARSKRLLAAFERAPLATRADMLLGMCLRRAPLDRVWPAVEEVLTCSDERVLREARTGAAALRKEHKERLIALFPRIVDRELRESLRILLRLPAASALYWQADPPA